MLVNMIHLLRGLEGQYVPLTIMTGIYGVCGGRWQHTGSRGPVRDR